MRIDVQANAQAAESDPERRFCVGLGDVVLFCGDAQCLEAVAEHPIEGSKAVTN